MLSHNFFFLPPVAADNEQAGLVLGASDGAIIGKNAASLRTSPKGPLRMGEINYE